MPRSLVFLSGALVIATAVGLTDRARAAAGTEKGEKEQVGAQLASFGKLPKAAGQPTLTENADATAAEDAAGLDAVAKADGQTARKPSPLATKLIADKPSPTKSKPIATAKKKSSSHPRHIETKSKKKKRRKGKKGKKKRKKKRRRR